MLWYLKCLKLNCLQKSCISDRNLKQANLKWPSWFWPCRVSSCYNAEFGFSMRITFITHWCLVVAEKCSHHTRTSFLYPISEEAGSAQEAGRGQSQDIWPQLATGIFCTMAHHAQYINLGESWLGTAAQEQAVQHSVCGKQLFFICITSFWGRYFSLFVIFPFNAIYYSDFNY